MSSQSEQACKGFGLWVQAWRVAGGPAGAGGTVQVAPPQRQSAAGPRRHPGRSAQAHHGRRQAQGPGDAAARDGGARQRVSCLAGVSLLRVPSWCRAGMNVQRTEVACHSTCQDSHVVACRQGSGASVDTNLRHATAWSCVLLPNGKPVETLVQCATEARKDVSAALQHDRARAAAAIANGCQAHLRLVVGQHVEQPHEQHGAARADGMPQCHRTTVCITPVRTQRTR